MQGTNDFVSSSGSAPTSVDSVEDAVSGGLGGLVKCLEFDWGRVAEGVLAPASVDGRFGVAAGRVISTARPCPAAPERRSTGEGKCRHRHEST